jgi:hypothetical protein
MRVLAGHEVDGRDLGEYGECSSRYVGLCAASV